MGGGYGGVTRAVYQPLVFAQPEIAEGDERPLAQQSALVWVFACVVWATRSPNTTHFN